MLERIGSWWTGKILVLVLLGFAATDFLITMTLAAAGRTPATPELQLCRYWLTLPGEGS
jgi:hypothetical protein